MSKIECLFVLVALSVGTASCWDIVLTTGNQLEFYTNQTKNHSESAQFRDLTALAYDAVHNMLLFVDKQSDNASIFSYRLATKEYQPLVRRKSYENIQGIAFDPVERLLFWTDVAARSIYWISLKPGSKNDAYGNLLIKMDDEIPRAIAVDSCRGYVYWTNTNITKPTIERARFNGSDREVVIGQDIYMPVSIAVDQQTKSLYWVDDREGIHFSIEKSDLNGKQREVVYKGTQHQPNALSISNDSIYWVDWAFKTIWKLPKNSPKYTEPEGYVEFYDLRPYGIVANYNIEDQTKDIPECDALKNISKDKPSINETFSVPPELGLFCVHGTKVGEKECNCTLGYTGDRCEIFVCSNYCLQGDCSITADGQPKCSCKEGYIGGRCEIDVCQNYCVNNGVCSLSENQQPICKCSEDHEGSRCEITKPVATSSPTPTALTTPTSDVDSIITPVTCNCTKEQNAPTDFSSEHLSRTNEYFVDTSSCSDGWDSVRDPTIMVLGIMCGLLCVLCALLITTVMKLKRRPRIKKRIIVNKNVTPMTARPDQCEITIENCCNMNICETPCFEPRSTIRPTLLDTKPGKEEKKNLIANMEYPDDY